MSGQFRWGDLLDNDTTEREAAYLGTTADDDDQRLHYWDDGTTLPVLAGSASDDTDDDPGDDEDLDADNGGDDDEDEQHDPSRPTPKPASTNRAHRQAARFRIDAKEQRERADSAETRAGTPMAGKRAVNQRIAGDHTAAAVLAKKYPALHGRR